MTRLKSWLTISILLAAAIMGGQTPTQPKITTIQVIVTPDPSAGTPKPRPTPPQATSSTGAAATQGAPGTGAAATNGAAGTAAAATNGAAGTAVRPAATVDAYDTTDVFVMPREAALYERASDKTGVVAVVSGGERLRETAISGRFLRVTRALDAESGTDAATGFVLRDAVSVYPPGPRGTAELAAAGAALAGTSTHRTVGVAMLERASERLREEGTPDPAVEIKLGESAEALARHNGRWPTGVPRTVKPCKGSFSTPSSTKGTSDCSTYSGDAFTRALALASAPNAQGLEWVRDRATAGLLRLKYPETTDTLALLWQETADWLGLAETARDRDALEAATERLGSSGLALGRYLVATGRLDQLDALRLRLISAAQRATSTAPSSGCGPRLNGRVVILQAMRGDGSRAFPQEARSRVAGVENVVRVQGSLGSLSLATRREGQNSATPWASVPATPVLPVPGSLRVSRDGRFAAWIEVAGPSRLLPVIARLDSPEPAREIAILSSGRPLRDRDRENVLAWLDDFSDDGTRLGFSILAWDDKPGPSARRFVVSSADARILFETSKQKGYKKAVEGR